MTTDEKANDGGLGELAATGADFPVAPAPGIAAIALQMAMKYHDIQMVKDGALYQQYKLEGKNFVGLQLDMVLETAAYIEKWLISSNERIAKIVIDAIKVVVDDEPDDAPSTDQ
jgi:hypothetical protein